MPAAGARVAILVEDLFEEAELSSPRDALSAAGAKVVVVGPMAGRTYTGKHGGIVTADVAAGSVREADVDAIVIPGGYAPDKMRLRHAMVDLVRDCMAVGKPVAAICHGPSVLINANVLRGRTLTCWPSIAVDVKITSVREKEPRKVTARDSIRQDQQFIYDVDIPSGAAEALFQLRWRNNWSRYPTDDLDLFAIDPDGVLNDNGASLNSPEEVTVANPKAGTWTFIVDGFDIPARFDQYELRVIVDGKVIRNW